VHIQAQERQLEALRLQIVLQEIDRRGLPEARPPVDDRPGDAKAKTALDELVELVDRRRRYPVIDPRR